MADDEFLGCYIRNIKCQPIPAVQRSIEQVGPLRPRKEQNWIGSGGLEPIEIEEKEVQNVSSRS